MSSGNIPSATVQLNMVKIVCFILCDFYHNKKQQKKKKTPHHLEIPWSSGYDSVLSFPGPGLNP